MREHSRRDGCIALVDDGGNDEVVVEAVVDDFTPVSGASRCACGAELRSWSWRRIAADNIEINCHRCHRVLAHIGVGVMTHR
jgi:hypothetical protein